VTTPEILASLPGETRCSLIVGSGEMTVDELRAALTSEGPLFLTTAQASERYGWSRKYWAKVGRDMPGAFTDGQWHLPVEGCEAHVAAKASQSTRRKRHPWSQAKAAPSARAGA
jgi:hypothetical protein